MNFYAFYRGLDFESYEYLGAHMEEDGSTVFRTFAPAAKSISVIGEFNGWTETPMHKTYDGNFWECRIGGSAEGGPAQNGTAAPGAHAVPSTSAPQPGQMYKYRITGGDSRTVDHCDPYAFRAELRPGTASVLAPMKGAYTFRDTAWQRRPQDYDHQPLNIYEVQAGSWRIPDPNDKERHYTYRELADLLIPYLEEMHYTHLELMPITEYPSDESWGYQATGFFAPTARYGAPDDLRYLIDECHLHGIGVILDFVAVHFVANDYALMRYDGTPLFEYPNNDVGYSEWGTCNFMHSRGEVRSFLQSSVYYWLREFHFDGVRIDAVSNLIYWQGNEGRGANMMAVQFLQTMNAGLRQRCPNALLIAEDSSTYQGVTKSTEEGGLGFQYKWDLGWMNDTLSYMKEQPKNRRYSEHYHKLTFSIYYYYNDRYLLPFSHDEVVHGKATIVQKMNGADMNGKLRQARLLYAYMFAHPGKKLNFMGNELGGYYEYSEKTELDWWLLRTKEEHRQFHDFMRELNRIYAEQPALWAEDYERDGFEWTDCGNEGRNALYSFVRRGQGQTILAVFNFGDVDAYGYRVKLPDRDLQPLAASYGHNTIDTRSTGSAEGRGAGKGAAHAAEKILDTLDPRWGVDAPESAAETAISLQGDTVAVDLPRLSAQLYLLK